MFVDVESQSQKHFSKGYFSSSSTGYSSHDVDISPMDTYELFGVSTLYDLIVEGIDYGTVEKLIPQLFQHYDTVLKPWARSHKQFLESWELRIDQFIARRGL